MLQLKNVLLVASTYLFLLDSARRRLPLLWLAVFAASVLDVIGVGLIVPFVAVVTKPDYLNNVTWAKPFVSFTQNWHHENVVFFLGAIFLGVFILKSFVSLWLYVVTASFAYQQDTALRVRLLTSFLFVPYEYHLTNDRARILNALIQNINKFSASLLALLRLLSEGVVVLFLLTLLMWASPMIVLMLVVVLSIIASIYFFVTRGDSQKWGHLSMTSNKEMLKAIQESIEGLKEIRTLGIENNFLAKLASAGIIAQKSATGLTTVSILPRYFLEVGLVVFVVGFLLISTKMGYSALEIVPLLALLGVAGLRLLPSVNTILSSLSMVRYSFPAVKQLRDDMESTSRPLRVSSTEVSRIADHFDNLRLKDISFAYGGSDRPIIIDLSIDIAFPQAIGIIGGSGAGKTTLVDLILGLLTPQKGLVSVNGKPITDDLSAWWSMVAYIPQSAFLSDDTIRRNIALGLPDNAIDEIRIDIAIAAAQLGGLLGQLPDGKETMVGDRGIRLSGGQRQRIAIARALYFDRQVFIFDEATSALDSKTEGEIVNAIGGLRGSKTMIVIAHRLSTLRYCDRIIALESGRVVGEYGSTDEVENSLQACQV